MRFDGNIAGFNEQLQIISCIARDGNPIASRTKMYIGENLTQTCDANENGPLICSMSLYINRSLQGQIIRCRAFQVSYKPEVEEEFMLNVICTYDYVYMRLMFSNELINFDL